MAAQRSVEGVLRVPGLHPHLAGAAALRGHVLRVAAGAAGGLHQQGEEPLGRAEVAGKERPVGLHRRHQRDAAEVVALGDHLRAHQHVHLARMHLGQLLFERALGAGGVGVDAGHARGAALGGDHVAQQRGELLFELLRAPADGRDVRVAAGGAGKGHALRPAAVVAAQRAVDLVEHLVRAAVRAVALPAAFGAVQHGREAAPVQQHQALLAALHPLGDGGDQGRREHGAPGLLGQVHQPHAGQGARADAAGHGQAQVAPARVVAFRRAAGVPGLQRRRGRPQDHLGSLLAPAPDGQVARRIAGAFLLLVAGVVLLVHHDQLQARQAGEHGHARAQDDARRAGMRREPAFQALRIGHAAVQADHAARAVAAGEARLEALLQLRREVDLGHHHQRLRGGVGRQHALHGMQIDLGLAAAGAAVEEEGARLGLYLRGGLSLLRAQRDGGRGIARVRRIARRRGRAAQAARQLLGRKVAQLRRQGGQGDLAQRALVVARGEGHQPAPGRAQRRQSFQHARDGARHEARRQPGVALCGCIPHHAQYLASAQGHAHQRAGRERALAGVAQQVAHPAVRRCLHSHVDQRGRMAGRLSSRGGGRWTCGHFFRRWGG